MCHAPSRGAAATHRSHFNRREFSSRFVSPTENLGGEAFNEKLQQKSK
jgi:hypothetical protein